MRFVTTIGTVTIAITKRTLKYTVDLIITFAISTITLSRFAVLFVTLITAIVVSITHTACRYAIIITAFVTWLHDCVYQRVYYQHTAVQVKSRTHPDGSSLLSPQSSSPLQ